MTWIVIAHRSAASFLGVARSPLKNRDGIEVFNTREDAQARADECNKQVHSPNVHYTIEEQFGATF